MGWLLGWDGLVFILYYGAFSARKTELFFVLFFSQKVVVKKEPADVFFTPGIRRNQGPDQAGKTVGVKNIPEVIFPDIIDDFCAK